MLAHIPHNGPDDGENAASSRDSALDVIARAAETNRALAHENLGFLSAANGFMPTETPLTRLPDSHAAWDQLAADLPWLHSQLSLRRVVEGMPELPATADALGDESLLRAAAVLAFLSHAYHYVQTRPPGRHPEALARPWAELRRRLGRGPAVLTYIDLIVHNFRLIDPGAAHPYRVENMALLVPQAAR